jgi:hypothetical protein
MGPDDGAIEDQMFHIRVIGKMLIHFVPNILISPASKAFVDAIPMAILVWQQPPLGAAASDPEDAFDKTAALVFLADINVRTGPQELNYFGPLFIF